MGKASEVYRRNWRSRHAICRPAITLAAAQVRQRENATGNFTRWNLKCKLRAGSAQKRSAQLRLKAGGVEVAGRSCRLGTR
jgi:hypothetical protein